MLAVWQISGCGRRLKIESVGGDGRCDCLELDVEKRLY